jgi:hypothetical protein
MRCVDPILRAAVNLYIRGYKMVGFSSAAQFVPRGWGTAPILLNMGVPECRAAISAGIGKSKYPLCEPNSGRSSLPLRHVNYYCNVLLKQSFRMGMLRDATLLYISLQNEMGEE